MDFFSDQLASNLAAVGVSARLTQRAEPAAAGTCLRRAHACSAAPGRSCRRPGDRHAAESMDRRLPQRDARRLHRLRHRRPQRVRRAESALRCRATTTRCATTLQRDAQQEAPTSTCCAGRARRQRAADDGRAARRWLAAGRRRPPTFASCRVERARSSRAWYTRPLCTWRRRTRRACRPAVGRRSRAHRAVHERRGRRRRARRARAVPNRHQPRRPRRRRQLRRASLRVVRATTSATRWTGEAACGSGCLGYYFHHRLLADRIRVTPRTLDDLLDELRPASVRRRPRQRGTSVRWACSPAADSLRRRKIVGGGRDRRGHARDRSPTQGASLETRARGDGQRLQVRRRHCHRRRRRRLADLAALPPRDDHRPQGGGGKKARIAVKPRFCWRSEIWGGEAVKPIERLNQPTPPLTLRLNTNLTRARGADTPRSAHGPTIDESQSRPSYRPSPVVAQQLWM